MNHLILAIRNLTRNGRRTAIALSTISFGVIAMLLAGGFIEWIFWAMRSDMIESRLGDIQIVRPGYLEHGTADPHGYLLPEDSAELRSVTKLSEVRFITPRLAIQGLISFGDNTISFTGEGVDPSHEKAVDRRLALTITEGKDLGGGAEREAILGRGLARNLGAKPGDTVTLLVNTAGGGLNAVEAHVAGLFRTYAKAYDDSALRIPIVLARELARTAGAHTWIVRLQDTEQTDQVLARLRSRFPASQSALQFVPWHAIADFYNKTVVLFSRQLGVVRLIIALIIVLSISNLLVMSVLERTDEIGTLLAIGQRRRNILMLFLSEGLWLGIAGGAMGLLIGSILGQVISAIGIPMPPPPGAEEGFTGEILITGHLLVGSFLLAVCTAAVSAIYPAWKASRLEIVDALRHSTRT